MSVVVRWTFQDLVTGESWEVPINPNTAGSPFSVKPITTAQAASLEGGGIHRTRMFQAPSVPQPWEFGGVIRTQAHHDELLRWAEKSNEVRISDHLGRTFEVIINQFEAIDRRPTQNLPWRMTFTMRVLVLGRVA